MRHLSEYRDPGLVQAYLEELHRLTVPPCTLMEICGGQTHSLVKNGIIELLPRNINMVHGPGCPVCITPVAVIDEAIWIAMQPRTILCSFGDMLRVPGSKGSLLQAKAAGADIRVVYSPLEAVNLAAIHSDKQVVFLAVGFETTAPANALSVVHARERGLDNYSILASHALVPAAMEALLSDEANRIDGFLAAGHVCTVMGIEEYYSIAEKYKVPVVVTGFEPVDLVQGILMAVTQLIKGIYVVENQYARAVSRNGNPLAREAIEEVFEVTNRDWRGIGEIPFSGLALRKQYNKFDARNRFQCNLAAIAENTNCISGQIMKGLKKPYDCPMFGGDCRPEIPLGAPMVSSEGACAAYFHYGTSMSSGKTNES